MKQELFSFVKFFPVELIIVMLVTGVAPSAGLNPVTVNGMWTLIFVCMIAGLMRGIYFANRWHADFGDDWADDSTSPPDFFAENQPVDPWAITFDHYAAASISPPERAEVNVWTLRALADLIDVLPDIITTQASTLSTEPGTGQQRLRVALAEVALAIQQRRRDLNGGLLTISTSTEDEFYRPAVSPTMLKDDEAATSLMDITIATDALVRLSVMMGLPGDEAFEALDRAFNDMRDDYGLVTINATTGDFPRVNKPVNYAAIIRADLRARRVA